MADKVILLDFWGSMFGARVRIALAEKEIEYEHNEEDLLNKKSPLLLSMNPVYKSIPVLIHNGKPICESLLIVEYIDEVWKDKSPLLPIDPYDRAQARFWASNIDNKLYPAMQKIWSTEGEDKEAAKTELIDGLKLLEGALGEKLYFGGETFGYLDIALIAYQSWFYAYETCGNFSFEAECPKLIAWTKRCLERASVSKCLADSNKVYDFVLMLKKMLGSS